MAEFSWSTKYLCCSGNKVVFQTAIASSSLARYSNLSICGGKHTQRTQNASSERNCGFVSHQIDYIGELVEMAIHTVFRAQHTARCMRVRLSRSPLLDFVIGKYYISDEPWCNW